MAPLYVFFDATSTSGLAEDNTLVNSDFSWDFDTENIETNGRSKTTKGMVVGHVFESPGADKVQCKLIAPDGTTDTQTIEIVVNAFEGAT